MTDYTIDVTQIEDYQNINNSDALATIFTRAKSAVVNGTKVLLIRKNAAGKAIQFDQMDTLEALEIYRKQVFKYLTPRPPLQRS